MNLTPENKKIGKENFAAAVGSKLTRQKFLAEQVQKNVSSGAGLGSYYFGYGESIEKPIRVGVLGTGDEGSVLIGAINPKFIQVKAIADIRPYSRYRAFHGDCYSAAAQAARPGLMAKYGWKTEDEARKNVNVYNDYRELLEKEKELDGVIIALPLHLHAPAAIAAMKAGLHVLTEKLMGHSVHECKEMARTAAQTNKYLVTGHQRHYNILYDNAVELIRRGVLGDLHYIRAQWHRGNLPGKDSWQQPMPKEAKPEDPQADRLAKELESWKKAYEKVKDDPKKAKEADLWKRKIDQKIAQISDKEIVELAAQYGYQDAELKQADGSVYKRPAIEELIRWRLWNRTGGGLMAELGSHQLDAASIFISAVHGGKKQHPLCVMAAGNRPIFPHDRDVEDHVYCMFEFPAPDYDPNTELGRQKKITVAYASINGNGWGGYGETVFGTQGTLILETEKDAMLFRTHYVEDHVRLSGKADGPIKLDVADSPGKFDAEAAALGDLATLEAVRGYTEELEHWAWCISKDPENKDPKIAPRCGPKVALGDAVIALTANMAARNGERIEFKEEWFDPDSDETPEGVKPDLSRYA